MQSFDWESAPLDKNTLLEASAGTGKTYTLEHLILRLITEREIPLSSILVVTFTNAASREMQDRIRLLLVDELKSAEGHKKDLLHKAVSDFDSSSIMTIHGFCSRVLQMWPFESGVSLGLEIGGENDLAGRAVWDWFRRNEKKEFSPFQSSAYRAAYEKSGNFRSLVSSIQLLLGSDIFNGSAEILPGLKRKNQLESLINNWGSSQTRVALKVLSHETRRLNSPGKLLSLFKADGLGDGLGAKTVVSFHSVLARLDSFDSFHESLNFLLGEGKTLLNRINKVLGKDILPQGTTPLTMAFIDLTIAYDQEWDRLSPKEIKLSLARLFEFNAVSQIREELVRERIKSGELTFNDLIDVVHQILFDSERDVLLKSLQQFYKVLLVDEFQDTDQRQWDIFKRIFDNDGHNYFLIGDPKQSIYRFRGADLNVYLQVRNSLPSTSLYRLENNYRSHPLLLKGFNTLFPTLFGSESSALSIGYSPVGAGSVKPGKDPIPLICENEQTVPPIDFILMTKGEEGGSSEAVELWLNTCANQITDLLNNSGNRLGKKNLKASDMAVLFEKNALCLKLQDILTHRGIPAVVFQERDIFEAREISLIALFLAAVVNRDKSESIRLLLLSSLIGLSPSELLVLEDFGFLDELVLTFRRYRDRVDQGDLLGQFSFFGSLGKEIAAFLFQRGKISREREEYLKEPLMERVLRQSDGIRIFTNIRHILEILHEEQQKKRLNTRELNQFIREETFRRHAQERCFLRLERNGDAVQIMTLHSSKGLQFPVVFFGGGLRGELLNSRNPYLVFNSKKTRFYDFLKDGKNKEQAMRDDWEERKRLYYVAMTRAESKLYMPLYKDWDDFWLSWLYKTFSGNCGSLNPFEKHRIKFDKGSSYIELKDWIQSNNNCFRIIPPPEQEGRFLGNREDTITLEEPPLWNTDLDERYPSLYSFSSLTINSHEDPAHIMEESTPEGADYDDQEEDDSYGSVTEEEELTPETISGGAALGNVVHRIFELMDFALGKLSWNLFQSHEELETLIMESTLFYLNREWYGKNGRALKEMVWNTLNAPLADSLLQENSPASLPENLSSLTPLVKLHEREFLMAVKEKGRIELEGLFHNLKEGYLKGFIDLIFLWDDKYYIADWKTTRCAFGEAEPYDLDSMNKIMISHKYNLQYWIYTSALYRFMKKEKKGFSYERDFGGIFYFFNRGMKPSSPGRGIFFNRPCEENLLNFMHGYTEKEIVHD